METNTLATEKQTIKRYISLLALAETSTDSQEWLEYSEQARDMEQADPALLAIPNLSSRVAQVADDYRAEVSA